MGLGAEKPEFVVACEQQGCRPACGLAQSDQRLYYSPTVKLSIQTSCMQKFSNLAILCS